MRAGSLTLTARRARLNVLSMRLQQRIATGCGRRSPYIEKKSCKGIRHDRRKDGCASGLRRSYGDEAADSTEHAIDALTTTNSYEFEMLAAAPVWAALMQWFEGWPITLRMRYLSDIARGCPPPDGHGLKFEKLILLPSPL
jgi:hypothetical protein